MSSSSCHVGYLLQHVLVLDHPSQHFPSTSSAPLLHVIVTFGNKDGEIVDEMIAEFEMTIQMVVAFELVFELAAVQMIVIFEFIININELWSIMRGWGANGEQTSIILLWLDPFHHVEVHHHKEKACLILMPRKEWRFSCGMLPNDLGCSCTHASSPYAQGSWRENGEHPTCIVMICWIFLVVQ